MASKMAYSPTLVLKESYVALYKIYILKNPFSGEVFYVGQTLQELQTRLTGHIHQSGDVNQQKNEYVADIISKGAKPIIEAIETIPGTCRIDKALVNDREIYWIKYYKSSGIRLLNIASTHDDAECREYKDYLRSIKAGQGHYNYYYCGTTYGGHEVYDERKMQADGFSLPPEESSIIKIVERKIIVEKIVRSVVYLESPTVQTEYLSENGLEQPGWTRIFALSIPPDNSGYNFDEQEDNSDFEPESDFELGGDMEPEIEENDESDNEDDDPDENDDRDTFIVFSH